MSPELSRVVDLYARCLDWRKRVRESRTQPEAVLAVLLAGLFMDEAIAAIDAAREVFAADRSEKAIAAEIRAMLAEIGAPA